MKTATHGTAAVSSSGVWRRPFNTSRTKPQMNNTATPQPKPPFVVHRRSPGLHWWTDAEGKDHGPYVHNSIARAEARQARKKHERREERSLA